MNAANYISDQDDVAVLSADDREQLLRAIEFALPIRNRGQFYVWTQAYLQALIAHELLLCACGDFRRAGFSVLKISARPFSEAEFAEITDPRSGLMPRAIEEWLKNGEEPLVVYPEAGGAPHYERFRETLERCKLGNLVMHGARSIEGATGTYFIFAGLPRAFGAHQAYLLQLMMPYLRRVIERTLALEERHQVTETPLKVAKKYLTGRQVSILQWVQDGKSNKEIGIILELSPLTVKNHVQNILKKLKAHNRAQAVSRAISLKLLK